MKIFVFLIMLLPVWVALAVGTAIHFTSIFSRLTTLAPRTQSLVMYGLSVSFLFNGLRPWQVARSVDRPHSKSVCSRLF